MLAEELSECAGTWLAVVGLLGLASKVVVGQKAKQRQGRTVDWMS